MNQEISKQEATKRLTRRWQEQALLFPTLRQDVPLSLYLRVNRPHVMRHGLLTAYGDSSS